MSAPAFTLSDADYRAAERAGRRFRDESLTLGELAAEIGHWLHDRALLSSDLGAGDFRERDEAATRGGIAHAEHRLAGLMRTGERLLRSHGGDADRRVTAAGLRARFNAAKLVDLVDLAQTLTGQEARKTGNGRYRLRCPFHADDTPSLVIYPPGLGWHCFGCGIGGDAVGLVAELKQIPAVEALALVEQLCDARPA